MTLKSILNPISIFLLMIPCFFLVKDPVISTDDLNHDLDIICQWAYQWKMEFNPNKQLKYYFLAKKVRPSHPQLTFNGTVIKKVNEQKQLGLILDAGLSFKKHLDKQIIISRPFTEREKFNFHFFTILTVKCESAGKYVVLISCSSMKAMKGRD